LNGYRILLLQKHKKINIYSCFLLQITKSLSIKIFLAYQGYDTSIPAPRFWYLVFSRTSGSRHPDPYTMFSTPCFLLHIKVTTPWSPHQGFDTLFLLLKLRFLHSAKVFTPCFLLFKLRFQHPAKVSTPCFSSLKTCLPMSEHLVTSLLQSLLSFQKLHFKILRISSCVLHNNKFDDWKEDIS